MRNISSCLPIYRICYRSNSTAFPILNSFLNVEWVIVFIFYNPVSFIFIRLVSADIVFMNYINKTQYVNYCIFCLLKAVYSSIKYITNQNVTIKHYFNVCQYEKFHLYLMDVNQNHQSIVLQEQRSCH
jgi:hypothetical protein